MRKTFNVTLTSTVYDLDLGLEQESFYRIKKVSGIFSSLNQTVPLGELLSSRVQLTSKPGVPTQARGLVQIAASQIAFAASCQATMGAFLMDVDQSSLTAVMQGKTARVRISSSPSMVGQTVTMFLDYENENLDTLGQAKLSSLYPP